MKKASVSIEYTKFVVNFKLVTLKDINLMNINIHKHSFSTTKILISLFFVVNANNPEQKRTIFLFLFGNLAFSLEIHLSCFFFYL